jgi:hypothetical protein
MVITITFYACILLWTNLHYTHCCVGHEQGLFECIVEGTTLHRVYEVFLIVIIGRCLQGNVCCFPESVYKIHLEIMRLRVTRPKFLCRPMASMDITFIWKMFPMKAYQLVTMFRQTLQN